NLGASVRGFHFRRDRDPDPPNVESGTMVQRSSRARLSTFGPVGLDPSSRDAGGRGPECSARRFGHLANERSAFVRPHLGGRRNTVALLLAGGTPPASVRRAAGVERR